MLLAGTPHVCSVLPSACRKWCFGSAPPLSWPLPQRFLPCRSCQVLEMLAERHPEAGSYHFVEDKLSTLEKVRGAVSCTPFDVQATAAAWLLLLCAQSLGCRVAWKCAQPDNRPSRRLTLPPQVAQVPSLQQYQLYLVDWGYNTEPERQRAAAHGRIAVIGANEFGRLAGVAPARV